MGRKWEILFIFDYYLKKSKKLFFKLNQVHAQLIGTYECKADVKGRLLMPASLKKQLTPVMSNGLCD